MLLKRKTPETTTMNPTTLMAKLCVVKGSLPRDMNKTQTTTVLKHMPDDEDDV
jgi:hypothetical protein